MADLIITGMSLTGGGITITLPPTSSVIADTYFNYTTVLLSGNGTNNATNATFVDSSTNNFAITRNGNTTQGTFSPYGANWSNYFDGTGDYLSTTVTAQSPGTGNFTYECWFNVTNYTSARFLWNTRSGDTTDGFDVQIQTNGQIGITYTGSLLFSSTAVVLANVWNHIAVVRSGSTWTIYLNGSSIGTLTNSTNFTSTTLFVGAAALAANPFLGHISNFRYVRGTAVYTSAFTPPTTPLTAISGTSLLTCQSNRFIDNSVNNFTMTKNGDVSVQRFSPFSPTQAYSAGTIGGSGYFDGTGDYLTLAGATPLNVTGGTAFTIEAWIYPQFTGVERMIISQDDQASGNQGFQFRTTASNFIQFIYWTTSSRASAVTTTTTTTFTVNAWNHVAATWDGTTFRLFINGVLGATTAVSTIYSVQNNTTNIGAGRPTSTSQDFTGYITDMRLIKNTAVYTSAFTPPTAPLTAISGTSLLTNFTNAGIIDNTMQNNLETVGDAKLSTTQSKFGGSSMFFDGTGDYLTMRTNAIYNLTKDFTFEAWIYPTALNSYNMLIATDNGANSDYIGIRSTEVAIQNTAYTTWSFTFSINTWYHIAVSRSSNTLRAFINGNELTISTGSATNSVQYLQSGLPVLIGKYGNGFNFTGYIDDLRLTNGVARYTATFTPPTAALPTQ